MRLEWMMGLAALGIMIAVVSASAGGVAEPPRQLNGVPVPGFGVSRLDTKQFGALHAAVVERRGDDDRVVNVESGRDAIQDLSVDRMCMAVRGACDVGLGRRQVDANATSRIQETDLQEYHDWDDDLRCGVREGEARCRGEPRVSREMPNERVRVGHVSHFAAASSSSSGQLGSR
jgi:hypothetical protein